MLTQDFRALGVRCPKSGWLGMKGKKCPLDGTSVEKDVDLAGVAIEICLEGGGDVQIIRYNRDLEHFGSIAALCRY